MKTPQYFEAIRKKAAERWDKLEADEELAAPWWQLFRQIQSPRHVLSELLQNADDAGAQKAEVRLENGYFIFEHDGEDFTKSTFDSLCKFGFSNKRLLHTIGFRGIGFKSTFSLGETVNVTTPTLSVAFHQKRFTEPVWKEGGPSIENTRISVKLRDSQVSSVLQKTIAYWESSPVSLLFFNNILSLTLCGKTITRRGVGNGPIPGAKRIALKGDEEQEVFVISSDEEKFPKDALEEIRQERMNIDKDFSMPPCSVNIILGISSPQHFYVVLPTDESTTLPFSVNAPFIQDPARTGIKDPAISPTNRWLLERVGKLAAKSMQKWIRISNIPHEERVHGYQLLMKPGSEGKCDPTICTVFSQGIDNQPVLLTMSNRVVKRSECFIPPYALYNVWNHNQLLTFTGEEFSEVLSPAISEEIRQTLKEWELTEDSSEYTLIQWIESHPVPKPESWMKTILLWEYALKTINSFRFITRNWGLYKIFPVESSDFLNNTSNVVRIGDKIDILPEDEKRFLEGLVIHADLKFIRYIKRKQKDGGDPDRDTIQDILSKTQFLHDTPINVIIDKAFRQLEKRDAPEEYIRFAHILGILDATAPQHFRYLTRSMKLTEIIIPLSLDISGTFEYLLPEKYADDHIIHDDYLARIDREMQKNWIEWAQSSKSRLSSFLGVQAISEDFFSKKKLENWIRSHGGKAPARYPLRSEDFTVFDYEFHPEVWKHLNNAEKTSSDNCHKSVWQMLFEMYAEDPGRQWDESFEALVDQQGSRKTHHLDCGIIRTSWIQKLSEKPCIPDSGGILRTPQELLIRNNNTESLIGIEPFIDSRYDNDKLKPLLSALGVRSTPGSPELIVNRIRIFSGKDNPPVYELVKLYIQLDKAVKISSREEITAVWRAFRETRLIYTREEEWAYPHEVFRTQGSCSLKGVFTVLPDLQELPLWDRVDVKNEPTLDLLIRHLMDIPSGKKIDKTSREFVRNILARAPERVWSETHHWVSVDGRWKRVREFEFALKSGNAHLKEILYPAVKGRTADMVMVNAEVLPLLMKKGLCDLGGEITYNVTNILESDDPPQNKPWMKALGGLLRRISDDNPETQDKIHLAGDRIMQTVWTAVQSIEVTPYLKGKPVGKSSSPEIFWDENILYINNTSRGRLMKIAPSLLSGEFPVPMLKEAITLCYERDPDDIREYFEENYTLGPETDTSMDGPGHDSVELSSPQDMTDGVVHIRGISAREKNADSDENRDAEPDNEEERLLEEDAKKRAFKERMRSGRHKILPLIDLLAEKYSYHHDGMRGRYRGEDGSLLQKTNDVFQWEVISSEGDVFGRFWVHEGKLEMGFEIPVEVYELIGRDPHHTSLLIRGDREGADVIPGSELLQMIEQEVLEVRPAKYRITRSTE